MFKVKMLLMGASIVATGSQAFAQATPTPSPGTGSFAGGALTPRPVSAEQSKFANRASVEMLFHNPAQASRTYNSSLLAASCIVRMNADRAGSMIGGELTKDPGYGALKSGVNGRYKTCLRDGIDSTMPMVLSAAIAEKLVLRDDTTVYEDRAKSVNLDSAKKFHGDLESGPVTMAKLTRCIVVYSPGLARKVLLTGPGSSEELGALDAVYAATPECGVRQRPADIPSTFQRGGLAEGLYAWNQQAK